MTQHDHPATLRQPAWFALALLAIEAALLVHEHFTGGVRSHHLLDRPDLPAISNWLGLIVMPVLGWLLGRRFHRSASQTPTSRSCVLLWVCLICALVYGAAMATTFALGASAMTSALFFGLFLFAAIFPIYRIEYITGFVVGMAFVFGAVLPCLVAVVLAAVSFVVRFGFKAVVSVIRRSNRPPGTT